MEILREARTLGGGGGLVFPSPEGRRLSGSTLSTLLRGLRIAAVPHGFRSSFRDWCGECSNAPREVAHRDRTATRMFLDFLGRDRRPETLSQRDWDRFIRERRSGRVGLSGKPVSNRTIECDLKFLLAVLNWAVKSKDEQGRPLLEANPLRGLKTPKEKNPTRVVLAEEEYRALLQVSRRVDWRFHVALVLAHETGHRIGAIRGGWGRVSPRPSPARPPSGSAQETPGAGPSGAPRR